MSNTTNAAGCGFAERVIDPQGEVNDIVSSARDLKRVIDRQEAQINALTAENSRLKDDTTAHQADSWSAVWEQLNNPKRIVRPELMQVNCGLGIALRRIRNWQLMEAKLRDMLP